MEKKCFKCLKVMPISYFYKHYRMADGHLNKCKECTKFDTIKNRNENLEYYQKYDRDRSNLLHRVELRKNVAEKWKADPVLKKRSNKLKKDWSDRNTIKKAAHIITSNAIRDGKLMPELCEACGKKKVDAHHDDYTKPMEVRWLCRKHHAEHHRRKREDDRNSK